MRNLVRRLARSLVPAAILTLAATAGCSGGGGGGGPSGGALYVLAPDELHYGASYGAWGARWWQWALEHPCLNHPLYDPTGEDAAEDQIDPVWFIGGTFGTLFDPLHAVVERSITIPSGVALFFPIINVEADNGLCLPPNWGVRSITELRQFAYDGVNAVANVYCTVDGTTIIDSPNLSGAIDYRVISPQFSMTIPANECDSRGCGCGCGNTPVDLLVDPVASDGIWMMLAPMPPGEHTITSGGTFPTWGPFQIDVTYHITVTP